MNTNYMKIFFTVLFVCVLAFSQLNAQPDTVDIFELSLEELMEQEVSVASKKIEKIEEAPGIVSVITRDEIRSFPAKNLGEVLNRIAGSFFHTANYFADNVVDIRGQSLTPYNNHVLLLHNGRPVRDPISGGLNSAFFTSFPLNMIQKIEVIRGPGSVLYGSAAFSGVINIITALDTEQSRFSAETAYGSYNELRTAVSGAVKKQDFSANVGIDYTQNDGPLLEFTDFLGTTDKDYFSRQTIGAVANMRYKNLRFDASYLNFHPYAIDGSDMVWDKPNAMRHNQDQSYMANIGHQKEWNEKISTEINLTYNRNKWLLLNGENLTGDDLLGEVTIKASPTSAFNFIVGATGELDSYEGAILKTEKNNYANIYSQLDFTFWGKLKLIGGMQVNKIQDIEANFSPRIGAILKLSDKLGIKLLYSEAFRKAYALETSFDIPVFQGNKLLKPELIGTAEGQVYFNSEKINISVSGYYSQMSQIIIRQAYNVDTDDFFLKYENGGSHNFAGIELEGKFQFLKNFFATLAYTYQENTNDKNIDNASLHPNYMLKNGLLFSQKSISISLQNTYVSKPHDVSLLNPSVDNSNLNAKAFDLLSVNVTLKAGQFFQWEKLSPHIFAEIYNMLDEDVRYPEYTSKTVNTFIPLYTELSFRAGILLKFTR